MEKLVYFIEKEANSKKEPLLMVKICENSLSIFDLFGNLLNTYDGNIKSIKSNMEISGYKNLGMTDFNDECLYIFKNNELLNSITDLTKLKNSRYYTLALISAEDIMQDVILKYVKLNNFDFITN